MLSALQSHTSFNQLNKHSEIDPMSKEDLKALRNESKNLCESIEYGLFHLGDMMANLGYLADSEQDFSHCAMNNDNVKHIGGLIKANAYLLNALRETAGLAEYHLSNMKASMLKGGKDNE
ncbi:hypothetical protein BKL51_06800 [Rodentibacter sp. Ppn85]|nr:hypothetical protein BKL51_06800 [Rodentibacter sp. Ppn85]